MLKIKDSIFVKSVADIIERPLPLRSEFAFAGRSNVGKSSLINSILNRKSIAKVSRSPGKTRNVNYFLINQEFYLVDLPGYGYAKVSGSEQIRWQKLIENYVTKNNWLRLVFVLIDSKVGPKETDHQLFDWLRFNQVKFQIVLTKSDKINKNIQNSRKIELHSLMTDQPNPAPILFSAKTKTGREEVLNAIFQLLKQSNLPGEKIQN
jgi:GTP-binding protein